LAASVRASDPKGFESSAQPSLSAGGLFMLAERVRGERRRLGTSAGMRSGCTGSFSARAPF
jgi:hypothetical protein